MTYNPDILTTYPDCGEKGDLIDPVMAQLWMETTGRGAPVISHENGASDSKRTLYAAGEDDLFGRAAALICNSGQPMTFGEAVAQVKPPHGTRMLRLAPELVAYELAIMKEEVRSQIPSCL